MNTRGDCYCHTCGDKTNKGSELRSADMDVKPVKTEKTEDIDVEVEVAGEDPNELLDIGQDNVDSSVWLVKVKLTPCQYMLPNLNLLLSFRCLRG